MEMSNVGQGDSAPASKVWVALKRLDQLDQLVVALRQASVPPAADSATIVQILAATFGLNAVDLIFKMRNQRGRLIPLSGSIAANSKHTPYVLEVVQIFQHVRPEPKTIPMTLINKSTKTRLLAIERRIQRLEELLPQIKLRRNEKLSQEVDCLNQKLKFLHRRMQVAESHSWRGALTRAPLW
ncbi:uncharacterized protein ACBR49_017373 [Aulostomus maculatus]